MSDDLIVTILWSSTTRCRRWAYHSHPSVHVIDAEELIVAAMAAIDPDDEEGEPPLLPVLNHYRAIGSIKDSNLQVVRPCHPLLKSHID